MNIENKQLYVAYSVLQSETSNIFSNNIVIKIEIYEQIKIAEFTDICPRFIIVFTFSLFLSIYATFPIWHQSIFH